MKFFEYNITEALPSPLFGEERRAEPLVVDCLNPHSFVKALGDEAFRRALLGCDLLLPDGEGICMQLRKKGAEVAKVAGSDLHAALLRELEQRGGRVYYLGSREETLRRIRERLARECPHIEVRTHAPSFSEEFSPEENAAILRDIRGFAPDVLWVGMTAPKQEKWIEAHRGELAGVQVVGAIGAVFDFFSGRVKRAPAWVIRLKLEWLWRFVREPRRMWERNMVSTPKYLRYCRRNRAKM